MGSIPQGPAPANIVKWQIIKEREVLIKSSGKITQMWLMMLKYGDNMPEEEYERVLWGDLKTMFDLPSVKDAIWKLPHQQQILN
ncbi:hypothetical protein Tco_0280892 [Tanacetum coccineum]